MGAVTDETQSDVLKEYLESREKEVIDIMITLFSQESAVEMYGADREIKGAVEVYQEMGSTFEETIKRIASKFDLTMDDSMNYVKTYWKASA